MTRRSSYCVELSSPGTQQRNEGRGVADLELEARASDDGPLVVVRGEVDMATAPQLRDTTG